MSNSLLNLYVSYMYYTNKQALFFFSCCGFSTNFISVLSKSGRYQQENYETEVTASVLKKEEKRRRLQINTHKFKYEHVISKQDRATRICESY